MSPTMLVASNTNTMWRSLDAGAEPSTTFPSWSPLVRSPSRPLIMDACADAVHFAACRVYRRLRRCLTLLAPLDRRAPTPTQRAQPFGLCKAHRYKAVALVLDFNRRSALSVLPAHPTSSTAPLQLSGNLELPSSSNPSRHICALPSTLRLRPSRLGNNLTCLIALLIMQAHPAFPTRLKTTPNSSPMVLCCWDDDAIGAG
jgi:hypothetical protein